MPVAELAAQLPVLIRGIYHEDWSPRNVAETYPLPGRMRKLIAS